MNMERLTATISARLEAVLTNTMPYVDVPFGNETGRRTRRNPRMEGESLCVHREETCGQFVAGRPSVLQGHLSFRVCGGNPDGRTSGWLQRWIAPQRSGFPRIAGPLVVGFPLITGIPVLFQRGWEHHRLQWVLVPQDAPAPVEAAPDRRNNAHLVLHSIKDLGWSSGRWSQNFGKKTEYEFHQSSTRLRIRGGEKGGGVQD